MSAQTVATLLQQAAGILSESTGSSARLEAEILLGHLLTKPRSFLYAWPECLVPEPVRQQFYALVERRKAGEPSAYLIGMREFWSLELKVTRETLIPRPETELLVEQALTLLERKAQASIADLGTGSGAISAALAHERPGWQIFATELSRAALAVAQENFRRLGLKNIRCAQGSWCSALPQNLVFNAILSNPPYIASGDPNLLQSVLDWEPDSALISGSDGLEDIRKIVSTAQNHLIPGGLLVLEHGHQQGDSVRSLLSQWGYHDCFTCRDLNGLSRISGGSSP